MNELLGKLIYESPKTQSIDAVKALLGWKGRASDPLPEFVEMGKEEHRLVLVLSNKKDAYYTTTSRACSCPAATYHRGLCKHQRKYFPQPKKEPVDAPAGSLKDSLPGWVGPDGKRANGPVEAPLAPPLFLLPCAHSRQIELIKAV